MLEHGVYSVLSPEGFASILWKDSKRANQAAEVMKMTAEDLMELGIIDQVIPELMPACEDVREEIGEEIRDRLFRFLCKYEGMSAEEITEQRYERFRRM